METLVSFLTSESGLTLLAWVFATLFSAIFSVDKVKAWLGEAKEAKIRLALSYIEAAVIENRDAVEKMKSENGGKLSEEQKKDLEDRVVANLKEVAAKTGIDVIKIIGPDLIKPAIVFAVKKIKEKMTIAKPDLQDGVKSLFEGK